MSEKRTENWINFIRPDGEGRIGSPDFIRNLLRIPEDKKELTKEIVKLREKVYLLQMACERQLVDTCKSLLLDYVKRKYPDKSFQSWGVRKHFEERGFGWRPPMKALEKLVEEGKLTCSNHGGWYRLAETIEKQPLEATA